MVQIVVDLLDQVVEVQELQVVIHRDLYQQDQHKLVELEEQV
jgi:hypothetical protein